MILCLDNDEEGHFFSQQIRERYGDRLCIIKHVPENKDFNEDLVRFYENIVPDKKLDLEQGKGDELAM
jgi:hypothetical protein